MEKLRKEFEEWFLKLNYDFTREQLHRINRNPEKYFYTTTQALWEQFQEIKRLTSMIDNKIGWEDIEQDSRQSHIN